MSRLYFTIFLLTALSVFFGMHYYIYRHTANGLMFGPGGRAALKLVMLMGGLAFITGEMFSRQATTPLFKPIYVAGVIWLGIIAMGVVVFFAVDIVRIATRTEQFRFWLTAGALGLLGLMSLYSVYNVSRGPRIKTITIKSPKLPKALSGFSIVQLSDLHLNYQKSERWLDRIIDKANTLNPDVVVITGDLADADISSDGRFYQALRKLKPKYGVYAITGNHDFYNGITSFERLTRELNIKTLRNEHVTIAGAIELAGVDDDTAKGFGSAGTDPVKEMKSDTISNGADLDTALRLPVGVDHDRFIILLAHQPTGIFDQAAKRGVDLQLSGHTHWGQIPPMDFLIKLRYKYAYGLYKNGSATLYTTSGTDVWGPPMRLFSRTEIVNVILTSN
ncbi:MAG: metallophosphoesterase [Candidatus Brocadiia bacterium]